MSLISLVNFAERLLNQDDPRSQDTQIAQKSANSQGSPNSPAAREDKFTPSALTGQTQDTGQAAGLFSVSRFSFFSAAADFLLGPNASPQTNPAASAAAATIPAVNANAVAQQVAAVPAAAAPALPAFLRTLATTNSAANGTTAAASAAPAIAANTPSAQSPVPAGSTTAAPISAVTQQQLQSLDIALQALGLSPQDIQALNQVATIINDFNPAALAALVEQFQALAQETGQQSAATSAAGANGTAAVGAPANGGAFQVQELIIKFSGVNAQGTAQSSGNPNGGTRSVATNTGFQASAFRLQIEDVNLTLTNTAGQTAQIKTSGPAPNTASSSSNHRVTNGKSVSAGA
ncbi:MAG TPA: hypothetical protein VMI32_21035 [Candidatus Solibacter sp.]|nr:hypothetical protein [Candidatus Solibacter sp.]